MNKIISILLVIFITITSVSCSPERVEISQEKIDQAIQQSQEIIYDEKAIMAEWYRDGLTPSFKVIDSEIINDGGIFNRGEIQEIAIPHVVHVPLIVALFITMIASWLIAFHEEDHILPVITLAFSIIFILISKIFVHFFYGKEFYIPWHFSMFIGLFLPPIIVFMNNIYKKIKPEFVYYFKSIMIKKEFSKKKYNVDLEGEQEDINRAISNIAMLSTLISDDESENNKIAIQIIESASQIKSLGKNRKDRSYNKYIIKNICKNLKNKGMSENPAYSVLIGKLKY